MLLAPLRLGLDGLHVAYVTGLLETLRFPQSLGFIGGRPNHAIYFVGAQGTTLYGLDPHTTQPAAEAGEDWPPESFVRSVHCSSPVTMAVSGVDPSLALAFYCRDRADFLDLATRINQVRSDRTGGHIGGRDRICRHTGEVRVDGKAGWAAGCLGLADHGFWRKKCVFSESFVCCSDAVLSFTMHGNAAGALE
ncbi:unnamed protein product [Phaeothamnion confervicola]